MVCTLNNSLCTFRKMLKNKGLREFEENSQRAQADSHFGFSTHLGPAPKCLWVFHLAGWSREAGARDGVGALSVD